MYHRKQNLWDSGFSNVEYPGTNISINKNKIVPVLYIISAVRTVLKKYINLINKSFLKKLVSCIDFNPPLYTKLN